jgi:hypothetical protein
VSWIVRLGLTNGSLYFAIASHAALAAIQHGVLNTTNK